MEFNVRVVINYFFYYWFLFIMNLEMCGMLTCIDKKVVYDVVYCYVIFMSL